MPLRISEKQRRSHLGFFGDTGIGKSQMATQYLLNVERQGESAIIWDPDREYLRKFYNKDRGDTILDPTLAECPYYPIGDEAEDEGENIAVATCFFPDRPGVKDPYWQDAARRLFAYILTKIKPTTAELGYLMAHDHLIDGIIKNSEFKTILTNSPSGLRSSVISHMNLAAQPLRMMPIEEKGRRRFTIREYCEKRQGWIFITSTPMYTEAMNPLHTLWLALAIMRLSGMGYRKDLPTVHIYIEEASSIVIHQFHQALKRLRKTRNPVLFAIQNYSDFKVPYGDYAPAMFSQPYTKIIGRTSDPESAERLSAAIGKKRVKRLRQSVYVTPGMLHLGTNRQRTYTPVEEDIELVPAYVITNLPDRNILVLQPGKLTYTRLPVVELPDTKWPLLARAIPRLEDREVPEEMEQVASVGIPLNVTSVPPQIRV